MRKVKFKDNGTIEPCPKCGNKTEFSVHSQQVSEDCCEVWATCKCGYDPTDYNEAGNNHRLEDVMGGCDDDNCIWAVDGSWNEAVKELNQRP